MTPSTKRAIRTAYQVCLALIIIVPILLSALPVTAQVTAIVAAVGAVAKVLNALEDAKMIPAWLKSVPAETEAASVPDGVEVTS